jgi:hypothetical protein
MALDGVTRDAASIKALQTAFRAFAGCWIETQCPGCRHNKA